MAVTPGVKDIKFLVPHVRKVDNNVHQAFTTLNDNDRVNANNLTTLQTQVNAGIASFYDTGADLTLTTVYADTGCSLTLVSGTYIVFATFDFQLLGVLDAGATFTGSLSSGAVPVAVAAITAANGRMTVSQSWIFVGSGVLKTQAKKDLGTGTSKCLGANSTLSALRLA